MVGDELALRALQNGYDASLRQLQTLLEAQARLREVAELTAAETRAQLERLAEALSPQVMNDLRLNDPLGLSKIPAQDLADTVIRDVRRRLARLNVMEVAGQSAGELCEEATEELVHLRERNHQLEEALAKARRSGEQAEMRASVLQQALAGSHQPRRIGPPAEGTTASPMPAPEWLKSWQAEPSHEQDAALVQMLAETGVACRQEAARLLATCLGEKQDAASVIQTFHRCTGQELIETLEIGGPNGETRPLVRLTDLGRDACRLLWGMEPAPSQATALLAHHQDPGRAFLTLAAADLLRSAGYEVNPLPGPVALTPERSFAPDLIAQRNGQALLVHVACKTETDPQERQRKWGDYYAATSGQLCVVVPDPVVQDAVKSEILFWAGQRPLRLWMATLNGAGAKRGEDVWQFKREAPGCGTR